MSAKMVWETRVELRCGCFTRFQQIGYATPCPAAGDEWTCQKHGDTEVKQAWRHGR